MFVIPRSKSPSALLLALLDTLVIRVVDAPTKVLHILEAIGNIAPYIVHIMDCIPSLPKPVRLDYG